MAAAPLNVFYCYSHKDAQLRERLDIHLRPLKLQGLINTWSDLDLRVGGDWESEITSHLNSADITLLLVSADFIASDYCYGIEMKRALERHDAGLTRIIPIILKPCNWQGTPIARIQALPNSGQPITSWSDMEAAFADVVVGIQQIIASMNPSRAPQTSQSSSPGPRPSQSGNSSQPSQTNGTSQTPPSSPAANVSPSGTPAPASANPQTNGPTQTPPSSPTTNVSPSGTPVSASGNPQANGDAQTSPSSPTANVSSSGIPASTSSNPQTNGTSQTSSASPTATPSGTPASASSKPQANGAAQTSSSSSAANVSPSGTPASASGKPQANGTAQTSSSSPAASGSSQSSSVVSKKKGTPDATRVATDKAVRYYDSDKLGFQIWVRALKNFILSPDTTTPLTIGIDGAWGTGKSSFMNMLKDLLEPSYGFRRTWEEITWPWLKWLGPFIVSLFPWMFGKLIVAIGQKIWRSGKVESWLKRIDENLTYDPEIDNIEPSRCKQLSTRIAAWHCPMSPVRNPTVWFNAWKFDQEEQLWAALALAVLDEIKKKYWFGWRILFWIRLEFKRLSLWALPYTIWKIALPIGLGVLFLKFNLLVTIATNANVNDKTLPALNNLLPLGQNLVVIGAVLFGIIQISSIIKDPFQLSTKSVFDKPDYKDKIGFIGSLEEDFKRIVSLITCPTLGWKAQKLIIFIDDLDRCKLPKAVDIIEGINLFLDSEQCVFVMGMDTTAVVASIEIKYQDLFKQMQEERIDMISGGRFFLDKIIQIPLHVPPATATSIQNLVKDITEPSKRRLPQRQESTAASAQGNPPQGVQSGGGAPAGTPPPQPLPQGTQSGGGASAGTSPPQSPPTGPSQTNIGSYTRKEVLAAIDLGVSLLPENPRQVKRFINLFRLYIYVASEYGLFEEENQIGLTMNRLAVWVVWSLRWNELTRHLLEETSLVASASDLRGYIADITKLLEKDGSWSQSQNGHNSAHDTLIKIKAIKDQQAAEERKSHWCYLPWERWFRNCDFLRCAKELEIFWSPPQPDKTNWLSTMLLMTKITSDRGSADAIVIPASNGNAQATNQQNFVILQPRP